MAVIPSSPKRLEDWLAYISVQHSREMELGLERLKIVARRLGLVRPGCPLITIAGTNGKGSCLATLESIYSVAGYRVAAYTSPHLTVFNERIRVDRRFSRDDEIIDSFQAIEEVRGDVPLTYFEFATLAALLIFSAANAGVMLLEVGLGGRLDATNLFPADVALITQIGLDHVQWLGEDREAIGREKAGIIHPHTVAVLCDPDPPDSLRAIADGNPARAWQLGRDFCYREHARTWDWSCGSAVWRDLPRPCLPGRFQLDNAAGALMTVHALEERLPVAVELLRDGIHDVTLQGRYQLVSEAPRVILDVAHNPDAAAALAANLAAEHVAGRTFAVTAMLADKDIPATLKPLAELVDTWCVAPLEVPRGARAGQLAGALRDLNAGECIVADSVEAAYQHCQGLAGAADRVIVFGSFHTVGAILSHLQRH